MTLELMPLMRLDVERSAPPAPPSGDALLLEDGVSYLLLEDGGKILLEN